MYSLILDHKFAFFDGQRVYSSSMTIIRPYAHYLAKCEFPEDKGLIFIREKPYGNQSTTEIYGEMNGLTDGLHGFHVHEFGGLRVYLTLLRHCVEGELSKVLSDVTLTSLL